MPTTETPPATPPSRGDFATKDSLLKLGLVDEHARHCVAGAEGEDQIDKTDELMAAVARLLRRG